MGADALVTAGARASAGMVLTYFADTENFSYLQDWTCIFDNMITFRSFIGSPMFFIATLIFSLVVNSGIKSFAEPEIAQNIPLLTGL